MAGSRRGEQIGERRYYDERLTQFLLRYRDPVRYGAWNDRMRFEQPHPDAPALRLAQALNRVSEAAFAEDEGIAPPPAPPFRTSVFVSPEEQETEEQRPQDFADHQHELRKTEEWERSLAESPFFGDDPDAQVFGEPAPEGDVAPTSPTSAPPGGRRRRLAPDPPTHALRRRPHRKAASP